MRRYQDHWLESGVLPIIRSVRRRWRLRVMLTGGAVVLAVGLAAFVFFAWGLDVLRFSPTAVVTLRVLAWAVLAVLAAVFLVRPLLRRVSDEQVALYLEEHEPSLEAAILGAVAAEQKRGRKDAPAASGGALSDTFLKRLIEQAVDKARAVEYGRRIEQRPLYRSTGVLGVLAFASLAFLLLAPPGVRHGMSALMAPTRDAADASPYAIAVTPGDVTIARGSDQFVAASLSGFHSDDVSLFTRAREGEPFQRLSMIPAEEGGDFELLLLNLQEETTYFVESNGIRSATHRIRVEDLPYVERLAHEYRFPAYAGLEPRHVEPGRDVAGLRGTVVRMTVHPTMTTRGGRLVVDDTKHVELVPGEDGSLVADLEVTERGIYRVELEAPDGRMVNASPTYTIDVLRDQTPSVRFVRPGRDSPASPIDEVYLEARADDDYGVASLFVAYSVNGAPEDTVALYGGEGGVLREVTAGHTLFLEEWELEPGDIVTYYAVARDNDRPAGGKEVKSDLYFINVRPFGREYRQAEQMGGGAAAGGGQPGAESALSELQRQVIAATFNLVRDRERFDDRTFSENATSVALAQGRVRAQVQTLVERMTARGVSNADPRFREIAELLPQAIEDMELAEERLKNLDVQEALTPEQMALRVILRAEETYERFVGEQPQGGGGGGGGGANAEDLADLFELELDKLRNQYETVQRGERREADNEVDELLEKLKDLARRQQQEAERQRRAAAQQQQGASGGTSADGQRALADEAEEAARRLERLAREQADERLEETARRLQQAADAMRRSAASSGTGRLAEVASALDRLDEAQRRLERARENRSTEAAQDAQERVRRLAESQRQVQEELDRLAADGPQRAEQLRRLIERKEEMFRETQDLEGQLDRLSADLRRESPEVGTALGEAADQIRDSKLPDKLAFSRGVVQQRDREFARQFEEQIASDIAELERRVDRAAAAAGEGGGSRDLERALERAQDLVRGAESLERRMAERGEQGEGGGEPSEGSPGGDPQQGGQGQPQGQDAERRLDRAGGDPSEARGGGMGVGGEPGGAQPGGGGGARNLSDPGSWSEGPRRPPRPLTSDEIRQYQREFAERLAEATDLRQQLLERGEDVEDLDRAIAALRQLQDARVYGDLPQVALLQESLRESLRQVEFSIRRQLEGDAVDRVFLAGSDAVPTGFRRLVEEYYRSLARDGGR